LTRLVSDLNLVISRPSITMKNKSIEKITYITPKGLEKLEAELLYLRTEKRREIAVYLQETLGDVEDNEYLIAMEEQAFVEGRINQLEGLLANVKMIEPGQKSIGIVDFGSTVVVREGDCDAETFTLVGPAEADPLSGLISNESPLGKALMGSKLGDEVEFKAPDGILKFRVLAVQ
jgi:transcription elongation factor GreA